MKYKAFIYLLALLLFSITVSGADIERDITAELNLEQSVKLIPEDLEDTEIEFSPSNTPVGNGLSVEAIFKVVIRYLFDALSSELSFLFIVIAVLVFVSVLISFIDSTKYALVTSVQFASTAVIAIMLTEHLENAFVRAVSYIEGLTTFMTGLSPFFGAVSLVGGETATAAVQKAIIFTAVSVLQTVIGNIALPVCKTAAALSVAGYISGISFGSLSELISGISTKLITVSCGIMCAILYFQNTVSAVTDSLALRSVKLAAGSFIPIVGSFVSEASGTLISGVRLVKSTFGVFAICVLLYMSLKPIVNFFIIKLSLRFSSAIAKILGCDKEGKLFSEISAVYNIMSATMIASTCFFIFFVAVFIKSEVR